MMKMACRSWQRGHEPARAGTSSQNFAHASWLPASAVRAVRHRHSLRALAVSLASGSTALACAGWVLASSVASGRQAASTSRQDVV